MKIDTDYVAKREPCDAFRYLNSYFTDLEEDDCEEESETVREEDLIDEEEKKELDAEDDMDLEDLFVDDDEDDE